jgi:hypothetical protein
MEGLSRKAVAVLSIIRRFQKVDEKDGKKYCFAGQKRIATECGWSVPSVRRAIRELKKTGVLLVERTNRTNHYSIGDTAQNDPSEPLKMIHPDGSKRSIRTAQNDPSEAEAPLVESLRVTAAANAAAVALETSPEKEAVAELVQFGLPAPQAERVSPSLAAATVVAVRQRLANPKLKAVGNVTGLIVRWLQNPEFHGFTRGSDGVWQPPGRASAKPPPTYLDREITKNKARRAAENAAMDRQKPRLDRLNAAWDALPAAQQEAIKTTALEKFGIYARLPNMLHLECLRILETTSPPTKGPPP